MERNIAVRSKLLLVIIAVNLSLAAGLFAIGCSVNRVDPVSKAATTASSSHDASPPKSDPDSEAFRATAIKSCVESATRDGVPAEVSYSYCDCAINGLLKQLDSQQIADVALSGDTDLPPDVEDKLSQNVLDCIDKLVSE
jgi:hypothetical protein